VEHLRILVVDDEAGMRLSVARALRGFSVHLPDVDEEAGFELDQASTAEEALEKLERGPSDLVLLDLKLPGMSGLDLLHEIEMRRMDLLVVMITAFASIETAVTATKRGAFDFLPKPFTPKDLRETVRKATEHLTLSRRAKRLAEERRQVRFQFISVLAHELKAPLGAIEGYLNILHDRTLGGDIAAYDQMIERSLTRIGGMRKMIADLTDLTRIESGKKKRELGEVNLREVAQAAMDTVLPDASRRNISLNLHGPERVCLRGDRGEIEIVLNNLVTNAVKYNRDGGRVDIRLSDEGEEVRIEVQDTGIGMSPEESAKLFNEFVRIKNEKTKNILGSGLGLSIVKKLANLYGGDVTLKSEPDKGSTFTVRMKKHLEEPSRSGN
jgi:signal transduction histidine kinase